MVTENIKIYGKCYNYRLQTVACKVTMTYCHIFRQHKAKSRQV